MASNSSNSNNNNFDVIIVGGGVSGIAAAGKLCYDNKHLNILILEGRDRMGGRVYSTPFVTQTGEITIEVGAAYVQGVKNNSLMEYIKEAGTFTLFPSNFEDIELVGTASVDSDFVSEITEELENQIAKKRKYIPKNKTKLEVTLQDIINNIKNEYFEEDNNNDSNNNNNNVSSSSSSSSSKTSLAINAFCCSSILTDYGTEPENLSGYYFDQDDEPKGGNAFLLPSYSQLIQYLLSLFPHCYINTPSDQNANFTKQGVKIALSSTVTTIDYSHRDKVKVIDQNNNTYSAPIVIITVPVAVLKSNNATRSKIEFQPPLPVEKREAIERFGLGYLNKIFVEFSDCFWNVKRECFYNLSSSISKFPYFYNLFPIYKKPMMLIFIGGTFSRSVDQGTEQIILQELIDVLKSLFHVSNVVITHYYFTHWHSDPYSLSSYSCMAPNQTPNDYEALATPVGHKLFFAGEATQRAFPASVNGAFDSGFNVAKIASRYL